MTRVAMLGTGVMGSAMARRAAAAGLEVTAWSLPLVDAERLEPDGIAVRATAASAAAGADLVVTMVPDAAAIESFADGPDGFLHAMAPEAVWVQCSTVGVEAADRLIALAERHGVTIADAPVLGSKAPAEEGELIMLASGTEAALERCAPFFAAVAADVVVLGPAGKGSRMKIVTNTWIMATVASLAEAMALAEALDVDGTLFLQALAGTAMDMGYAQSKGGMIVAREYPVQMSLSNGAKDARLAAAAAREHGLPARVIGAAAELMQEAADAGHGGVDMAAAFHGAVAQAQTHTGGAR
jgi:3-hydroxyisobutyrate dehydrogenase